MIIKRMLCFLCVVLSASLLRADTITVYNESNEDLYVALYYQKSAFSKSDATRVSDPILIKIGANAKLERPSRKLGYDRALAFDLVASYLKNKFSASEFQNIAQTNIGDLQGSTFYLERSGGYLQGFNTAEWKFKKPFLANIGSAQQQVQALLSSPIKDQIRSQIKAVRENPYKDTVAKIRIGNSLHPEEKAYLAKRKPKVKTALEKFLGHAIDDAAVPTIALIESGGGYRAMTCSLGWHVGASKIGLMDTVTYMVGLSGSTWLIGLWTLSGKSIEEFKQSLFPKIKRGLSDVGSGDLRMVLANFLGKSLFDQELTIIDFYGGLLANALLQEFGPDRQRVYLSEQAQKIANANIPFPIYTAVRGDIKAKQDWYEFTPYEIGATWLGMYVPSWAYGREFDDGASIDFAPEQSFGYQMGTFGSAFSASAERIFKEVKKKFPRLVPFIQITDAILNEIETQHIAPIATERITAAILNNFTFGMQSSPIKDATTIKLVDGGLEFNLPYPPISGERPERKADIIIFLDASGGQLDKQIRKVEQYARTNNLKFPQIDYSTIAQRTVSTFKDENDPAVPLVIYMPRINDLALLESIKTKSEFASFVPLLTNFNVDECIKKDYCATTNFSYDEKQMQQLSGLTEFNMLANKDKIKEAIEWKVKQMSEKK